MLLGVSSLSRRRGAIGIVALLSVFCLLLASSLQAAAAGKLADYLPMAQPGEMFEGADRFGDIEGDPPVVRAYKGQDLVGYVYLNSDFASSVGYSGKPIQILVGIDPQGVVRGFKLVEHKEPIVLVGIPVEKVIASLNSLIGKDMGRVSAGSERPPQVDIVSGATVTVLVMGDSIVRSAVRLIRSNRLGGQAIVDAPIAEIAPKELDTSNTELRNWEQLIGDGSVRSLRLTIGEVSADFRKAGKEQAADRPEQGKAEDRFIDLYIAPASVPSIGLSLLGERGYERLKSKLKAGQHAIIVAGDGAYSFKGSGYVRGGIFDRVELLQDGQGVRFRDHSHTRLGDLAATGSPRLREIALFIVPESFVFDVTAPWELQLLVQRSFGAREKAILPYNIGYTLPDRYVVTPPPPAPVEAARAEAPHDQAEAQPGSADATDVPFAADEPLWVKIWKMNTASIGKSIGAARAESFKRMTVW